MWRYRAVLGSGVVEGEVHLVKDMLGQHWMGEVQGLGKAVCCVGK
jgi:hypothetical protein